MLNMAQRQRAVAAQVHAPHLDVGLTVTQVVLARQGLAHFAVARVVVDGTDFQFAFGFVVLNAEKAKVAHQLR